MRIESQLHLDPSCPVFFLGRGPAKCIDATARYFQRREMIRIIRHSPTEVLALIWVFCITAGAQDLKPQVQGASTLPGATATPSPMPAPGVAQGTPVNALSGAQPLKYPFAEGTVVSNNTHSDVSEAQALMNAFGTALRAMGGGASSGGHGTSYGGYRNYGGRSDIASPSGDDGVNYSGSRTTLTPVSPTELSGMRKIIPPFQKWFSACTKGLGLGDCRFENMGIMGDAAHRARRSCHNSGEAIDVGTVTCSGGQKITTDSPQFFNLANCLANDSKDELQVVFYKATGPNMIQKSDHNKHMHIQLKNCAMVYGSK